ncbi:LLM class flavin-dependent oxidoreductase [Actinomadura sp. KC06]|uniref:LLM class flavin-dependent oxidoreductase n=1 Tax=Actinomadura sp. KC06 TaxID=2530369 RepID=UPI001050C2EC|nr:LLM class flavin-dependent oxidoreductase [Actinomadura sp. KC06]TDD37565.1 LLM class flavin-dependent oxidoreductase [Actinomadura sp. KC06]
MPPTFGIYLPQTQRGYPELLELAVGAETCGFEAVWFMDHLALPGRRGGALEGWTVAAAVAARTSRIRIGHLVLCAAFRPPALLGRMAVTLDQISEGRLNLGLGWGSSPSELTGLGLSHDPPRIRREKLGETIEIVRAMATGASVDYEGEHFTVRDAMAGPPAVQQPVPLYIGGTGPKTMELVRQRADWWNCWAPDRHRLPDLIPLAGPARVSVNYSMAFSRQVVPHDQALIGPPQMIAEELRADRLLGVEHFVIQMMDPAGGVRDLERFMDKVAPAIIDAAR